VLDCYCLETDSNLACPVINWTKILKLVFGPG